MAHLIDKDALVAEIEKLKKTHDNWSCMGKCFHQEYEKLLSFLDTLEAKEIDSESLDEKAIAKYLYEKKGYPITLNGNLPSYEETMKDANQYINYKKEQFIDKASIWFNDYFASHDVYGVIAPFDTVEEMFEDFRNYIKGE